MFELMPTTLDRTLVTAPDFRQDVWGAATQVRTPAAEAPERVHADTAVVLSVAEMAEALTKLGGPAGEGAELSVDPDDYPLF
jgi:hypothetical protein